MKIKKIEIKNFRILDNINLDFDDEITLIVGRNNTGKTSLSEIFYKFLNTSYQNKFRFEDFSLTSCANLKKTEALYIAYQEEKKKESTNKILKEKEDLYQNTFPKIELDIYIEYTEDDNLSSVSNFIMDLDPAKKDVLITCCYGISNYEKTIQLYTNEKKESETMIQWLKNNFTKVYEISYYAVNTTDKEIKNRIDETPKTKISDVFLTQFITAQRILDDQSIDETKGLTKGFGDYYKNNNTSPDTESLKTLLEKTSCDLDGDYKRFFQNIFIDLQDFGVNTGLNMQQIEIKSKFDLEKVLKDNATLYYKCDDDELLPESHNGLGYSNLIYIILQFFNSFEEYSKRTPMPNFSLLFLEEPEAHLHPQMQQTFIKNVKSFIQKKNWNVQVIITTHSPHIVADSGLKNIRYFEKTTNKISVKNLSNFQEGLENTETETIAFLKQYMTLYNCDMFFADKIIMVEGVVERLLLPEMIKQSAQELENQYVSLIEIGGAYAFKFQALLNFLNIKTIIITDIDSVEKSGGIKCPTDKENCVTCNQSLVKLISKTKISDLLSIPANNKIIDSLNISYQIPETPNGKCGRSFEEAFILKNAKKLAETTISFSNSKLFTGKTEAEIIANSYNIADKIPKKTDFAFDIITIKDWETPLYIKEALIWLSRN